MPSCCFQVYNLQSKSIKGHENLDVSQDEILRVVEVMRREGANTLIRNIILTPEEYYVTVFEKQQLNNIVKFCVDANKILGMDTTFNICDMWVTDTVFQNLRLTNDKGEHPWFYGPVLLHMKKSKETFSRFAIDLVVGNSNIQDLPFLGTDLEKAMFQGFKGVMPNLKNLLCVKHMADRDQKKLTQLKARGQRKIIADIYGTNDGVVRELGLASADDEDDFTAKLMSLKEDWEELAPTFHDWFCRHRAQQFIESVIESARIDSDIDGLFYNNAIESLHAVLKQELQEKKLPIV